MNNKYKSYFILADQYFETSELLLNTLIENKNTTLGIGNSEEEAICESRKNSLKSDFTLFIPSLFLCMQSVELFLKGIILMNKRDIKNAHETINNIMIIKEIYGEQSDIYIAFNKFYKYQIDITKKYSKENNITTQKELYESLRYPENKTNKSDKKKEYDYYPLKNNFETGIKQYKKLLERMDLIKNAVLNEYQKIE